MAFMDDKASIQAPGSHPGYTGNVGHRFCHCEAQQFSESSQLVVSRYGIKPGLSDENLKTI
jgi:hypothetical protein